MSAYKVKQGASLHTCWDHEQWDGRMQEGCGGCTEADRHPCHFCGYGHVFTSHNPEAHADAGDADVEEGSRDWLNSPHEWIGGAA